MVKDLFEIQNNKGPLGNGLQAEGILFSKIRR
jgi:hypothetical protein